MGLFSERKPYTAISAETDALVQQGPEAEPSKLFNLVELIRGSRPPGSGAHEAGRVLRKKLKHGAPSEQRRALSVVEMLIDNGVRASELVTETGLGEQLCATASSHGSHGHADSSRSSKVARHAQVMLADWSRRKDPNLSRWFKQAGLAERTHRSSQRSVHPDDDLDAAVFADNDDDDEPPRSPSRRASWGRPSRTPPRSPGAGTHAHARSQSRADSRSRSPSPINLRGAGLTTTIATAHNVSTRLTNALITNRPGSRETEEYYRQAKQLRRRVIQLVHDQSPEVQSYVGQLLHANEELIQALQAYDAVSSGRDLDAQDDHAEPALPKRSPIAAARPPPSPTLGASSDEDLPQRPGRSSRGAADLDDPFADHNEQSETPKHTPFW